MCYRALGPTPIPLSVSPNAGGNASLLRSLDYASTSQVYDSKLICSHIPAHFFHTITIPIMNRVRDLHPRLLSHAARPTLLNARFFSGTASSLACHSGEKKQGKSEAASCHKSEGSTCASTTSSTPKTRSMLESTFWSCRSTWRRSGLNTLRCLVGCTIGDFSALWTLQSYYPELGMNTLMLASSMSPQSDANDSVRHVSQDRLLTS